MSIQQLKSGSKFQAIETIQHGRLLLSIGLAWTNWTHIFVSFYFTKWNHYKSFSHFNYKEQEKRENTQSRWQAIEKNVRFYSNQLSVVHHECVIACLTMISECLGYESLFCSSIMDYATTQYIKIIVVSYFGEVIKTTSVLMMLLFSFERYKITTDNKNESKLSKMKLKWITIVCFLFSFLTSYTKINEYGFDGLNYFAQTESPRLFIFDLVTGKYWFYVTIYVFHYIFNDFILLLINLIIDIRLVIEIRRDLKSKKDFAIKNHDKSSATTTATTTTTTTENNAILEAKYKEKLNDIKKANKNTIKMIVYSFMLYFFCRFPELCFYLYLIFAYKFDLFIIHTLGPLGVNVVEYIYVVSYSFNIFFYFKFNKNFRTAFKNLFKKENSKSK